MPETPKDWVKKRPDRARRLYYGNSREAAVKEYCIGCIGSAREAKMCPADDCPLWPFRPGRTRGEVPDWVEEALQ